MLREAEERATEVLSGHRRELTALVDLLLEQETVDGADVYRLAGRPAPSTWGGATMAPQRVGAIEGSHHGASAHDPTDHSSARERFFVAKEQLSRPGPRRAGLTWLRPGGPAAGSPAPLPRRAQATSDGPDAVRESGSLRSRPELGPPGTRQKPAGPCRPG